MCTGESKHTRTERHKTSLGEEEKNRSDFERRNGLLLLPESASVSLIYLLKAIANAIPFLPRTRTWCA